MRPRKNETDSLPWHEIQAAFEEYEELPPAQREKYLEELGESNPALRAEVESLRQALVVKGGLLDRPLASAFASAMNAATPVSGVPRAVTFHPRWLGKYVLLRRLGFGGMAEVYLAITKGPADFERLVALKRPLPEQLTALREHFEYEAKLSAVLNHANIIQVYDFSEFNEEYLLAMEYVEGRDLSAVFEKSHALKNPMPPACAIHIALETCKALDYAHNRRSPTTAQSLNLVHRDVSPKNIMLSYEGDIKLFDFGISKTDVRATLTVTGALCGTVPYLAPEVASGGNADPRSDLFAICLVLYEGLSGHRLFEGQNVLSVLNLVQTCELPHTRISALDVPPRLKDILRIGLAKDPNQRYQTAAELEAELQKYLNELHPGSPKGVLSTYVKGLFRDEVAKETEALQQALEEGRKLLQPSENSFGKSATQRTSARQDPETAPNPVNRRIEFWLSVTWLSVAISLIYLVYARRASGPQAEPYASKGIASPTVACRMPIQSDPPGAIVLVNNRQVGVSPSTLTGRCLETVSIVIQSEGYESFSAQVRLDPNQTSLFQKLKKFEEGTLNLTLDRDAKIYIEDHLVAEVRAKQKIALRLEGNKKHHFHFVNQELGIDLRKEIPISAGASVEIDMRLDERQ